MSRQALDIFASELDATVLQAIDIGARSGVEKRLATLTQDYEDPDALRRLAGQLRQHSLDHLDEHLAGAERRLEENGAQVHFAATTARALEIVLDIVRASGTRVVTKSKSMASEELDLSRELASRGFEPLETDLGEFVVQLDDDHPSHIVKPIIHKTRHDVARSFERSGLGDYNDDPETITRRARSFMRDKFLAAGVTITGAIEIGRAPGLVTWPTLNNPESPTSSRSRTFPRRSTSATSAPEAATFRTVATSHGVGGVDGGEAVAGVVHHVQVRPGAGGLVLPLGDQELVQPVLLHPVLLLGQAAEEPALHHLGQPFVELGYIDQPAVAESYPLAVHHGLPIFAGGGRESVGAVPDRGGAAQSRSFQTPGGRDRTISEQAG